MPRPHEATVKQVLARNGRDFRIRACIENAWTEVKDKYPDRSKWRRKSTTRAVMWENSVDAVIAALESDKGIRPIHHEDTVSFVADDKILFRLKKAGIKLFTSNYPTQLAYLFHDHDADLFGHTGYQRVEIVHIFNRYHTELDWIGVVARERKKVLWHFELPQKVAEVQPIRPVSTEKPAAETVLRPIAPPAEKKTDEEQP